MSHVRKLCFLAVLALVLGLMPASTSAFYFQDPDGSTNSSPTAEETVIPEDNPADPPQETQDVPPVESQDEPSGPPADEVSEDPPTAEETVIPEDNPADPPQETQDVPPVESQDEPSGPPADEAVTSFSVAAIPAPVIITGNSLACDGTFVVTISGEAEAGTQMRLVWRNLDNGATLSNYLVDFPGAGTFTYDPSVAISAANVIANAFIGDLGDGGPNGSALANNCGTGTPTEEPTGTPTEEPTQEVDNPAIQSIAADCTGNGTLTVSDPVAGATITLMVTYHVPAGGSTWTSTGSTTVVTLVEGQTAYPFSINVEAGVPVEANSIRIEVEETGGADFNGETTKSPSFGPCNGTGTPTEEPTGTPTEEPTGTPTSTPDDGTPTSTPDDGTPTSTPDDGTPTSTPDDGTPTSTPDDGTPTSTPDTSKTPVPPKVEQTPTPPSGTSVEVLPDTGTIGWQPKDGSLPIIPIGTFAAAVALAFIAGQLRWDLIGKLRR